MVNISEIKAQVALLQRVEGYKSSESKRQWWIIDDESYEAKRRHLRNCMAILDQVGVNKSEAMKALGARKQITAITDITNSDGVKYFVKGMFNNCMFVSIRREADGMKEWQEPKLGLLVQKKSDEAKSVTTRLEKADEHKVGNVDLEPTSEMCIF